jgi:hypothetical protein
VTAELSVDKSEARVSTMDKVGGSINERIRFWISEGFRITAQTETSAQLVKPRRFNPIEFVLMPIYALEYFGQREQAVYLSTGINGEVIETRQNMDRSLYRRMQDAPLAVRLANAAILLVAVLVILWLVGQVWRS